MRPIRASHRTSGSAFIRTASSKRLPVVYFIDMETNGQTHALSPFTVAVYDFLRTHIDTIDMERMASSDFSTLLDLKKSVDATVEKGLNKWRGGETS